MSLFQLATILAKEEEHRRRMERVRVIDQEIERLVWNEIRTYCTRSMNEVRPSYTNCVPMECPNCNGTRYALRVSRSWFRTHTFDICTVCRGVGRINVEVSKIG